VRGVLKKLWCRQQDLGWWIQALLLEDQHPWLDLEYLFAERSGFLLALFDSSLIKLDQRMPHLPFRQPGHQQQRRNWVMMQFSPRKKKLAKLVMNY
jgi:hypothetical protein